MLHYVVSLVPILDRIEICRTLKSIEISDLTMRALYNEIPRYGCSKRFCTESILQKHQTPTNYSQVNVRGSPDRFDFYCPIHDAAYLGQKDAVPWWHI